MGWLVFVSVVMFVGTLLALPILIARLPVHYFTQPTRLDAVPGARWHAWWHIVGRILKNGLGLCFLLAGLAMLVLPGQGILTILLGLTLLDFPGKRALEWRLVQRPMVWQTLNWIRAKAQQPPLERPDTVAQPIPPTPRPNQP